MTRQPDTGVLKIPENDRIKHGTCKCPACGLRYVPPWNYKERRVSIDGQSYMERGHKCPTCETIFYEYLGYCFTTWDKSQNIPECWQVEYYQEKINH